MIEIIEKSLDIEINYIIPEFDSKNKFEFLSSLWKGLKKSKKNEKT
jgi:hypothetical protein